MPAEAYSGPKFDHVNRPFMKVFIWFWVPLALLVVGMAAWEGFHGDHHMWPMVTPYIAMLPVFILALQPRWQVAPEGIVDLRKSKKKQLIAPYGQIQAVRTVKKKGKTGGVFDVVTPEKTYKVDVLQADNFLAALEPYVGRDKIAMQ